MLGWLAQLEEIQQRIHKRSSDGSQAIGSKCSAPILDCVVQHHALTPRWSQLQAWASLRMPNPISQAFDCWNSGCRVLQIAGHRRWFEDCKSIVYHEFVQYVLRQSIPRLHCHYTVLPEHLVVQGPAAVNMVNTCDHMMAPLAALRMLVPHITTDRDCLSGDGGFLRQF